MRYTVLLTAPYMIPFVDRFRPVFEKYDLELIVPDVREEHETLATRVTSLDTNLRRFDEQAARMVTYFNEVTQQMEAKQEASHQKAIKQELEWVRSNAKGRQSKSKARLARFEELVAELFKRMGYDVTLTPTSHDGGRDETLAAHG